MGWAKKLSIDGANLPIQTLNLFGRQVAMKTSIDLIEKPHLHHPQCPFAKTSFFLSQSFFVQ
jgi:hypothetical protein